GYLITSILWNELSNTHRIDFKNFYVRRARRLLPALVLSCAAYFVYACVAEPATERRAAFGSILRALTYTTNLAPAWASWPNSHWFQHSWSLAVEEQFYLLWPPLLFVAWRFRRSFPAVVAVLGILGTVLLRMVPGFNRFAYEVLRWDALMCGCLLALVRPQIP